VGCVIGPPPFEEYTIARSAVQAARAVDSVRFAPGLWNRADESFREGEKCYRDSEFDRARTLFQDATQYAERAENTTRLKKFQMGDGVP